ncbi:jmjC domain-containing protein 7 isoform X2 [Amborella trichopoda]|uniref:JmjC domain-containing protein n=1 Tax=Amborella trichopoda TaxID=13333 RepID=W1NHQ6_AMBTC|nr:jmjC domain-containing protein 7 isoform X2 [Amborella trichopoda]ERM94719.1 hypothetical protein AMTR_s00011p00245220 [Amborella trichopoda]|eukprot:XP_006878574.1 jmjC domain-containing protein 7 isoform X2 [Amborella trichopoda]
MEERVEGLWSDVRELNLGTTTEIEHLHNPPTPLCFLRDFVSQNKPCLISNATTHWPALSLWPSNSYLCKALKDSTISLHLTPNGRADALTTFTLPNNKNSLTCFASAFVKRMPFDRALNLIATKTEKKGTVAYMQQQNDCLLEEFGVIAGDVAAEVGWATEAFGCSPEAANLWIGNGESETWWHKDHYENLYAVVSGEKHFLLLPPTDVHRLYVKEYPAAQYTCDDDHDLESGELRLELEEPLRYIPWCSVDPYPSPERRGREMSLYPRYFNGPKPFECTVKAGDMLYLPSMWFHHVRQTPDSEGKTIAVNYWYDMQFDIKYAYFYFLQSISLPSNDPEKAQHPDTEDYKKQQVLQIPIGEQED